MKTKLLAIEADKPNLEILQEAVAIIKKGELVAFPTETVYGLGADAFNPKAVAKIFKAKNRPGDNPLIVHISDLSQLKDIVSTVPKSAKIFMKKFWPGPLSIVFHKHKNLPRKTTAGLDTVVVRFPKHEVAKKLIELAGTPIAAPSANLSGRISPTRAEHVLADLNGKIPMILDAGSIEYGLESTVVDCTEKKPIVLRPGSITLEMLKDCVPGTRVSTDSETSRSPGTKYKHYAPLTPILLFTGTEQKTEVAIKEYLKGKGEGVVLLWHSGDFSYLENNYQLSSNSFEAAPLLFSTLREADLLTSKTIIIQGYSNDDIAVAIMNRLQKAATEIIEV
jgi:L-threonylcarbamoyladenylate synthase